MIVVDEDNCMVDIARTSSSTSPLMNLAENVLLAVKVLAECLRSLTRLLLEKEHRKRSRNSRRIGCKHQTYLALRIRSDSSEPRPVDNEATSKTNMMLMYLTKNVLQAYARRSFPSSSQMIGKGCTKCVKESCPVDAITGKVKKACNRRQ